MFDFGGMNIEVTVSMGTVKGERGWYFMPEMTSDGDLSWTNNGNLENPQTVNLRGPVGKGFQIKATYATKEDLEQVTDAENGDFFNVGTEAPYELFMWDGASGSFVSQGVLEGPRGEKGEKGDKGDTGTVFTPGISNGIMTWHNDGGLTNPPPVDLALELSLDEKVEKEEGKQLSSNDFTDELKERLESVEEGANKYVLPETLSSDMISNIPETTGTPGVDPLSPVFTGSDGKLGVLGPQAARVALGVPEVAGVQVALPASGWSAEEPYTQNVAVEGVTETAHLIVSGDPTDAEKFLAWQEAGVYCSAQAAGSMTFTCSTVPETDLTANVVVLGG